MDGNMEDPLAATALPSLLTSGFFTSLLWRFSPLGDVPLLRLAFFTLLPTLSALACLQDKRFLATFRRLFLWYVLRTDDPAERQSGTLDALAAARSELLKAIGDRWPTNARGRGANPFSLARVPHGPSAPDLSTVSGVGNNGNSSGKSLYDHVRSQLKDHVFPKNHDAPIYFMDPTSGSFLRVNEQHKLVFTNTPDASCLFHVVKGKTHHWGFHSTIHQRYIGQNVIGKVVVNSKKMAGWESFRVLERPEKAAGQHSSGSEDAREKHRHARGGMGRTVYFVLCSARFGKGMWLGKQRRTPSNPTDAHLTKNFAHALALVYASDLSAFEFLSEPRPSTSDRRSLVDSTTDTQRTSLSSSLALRGSESEPFGPDFQVPVLSSAERSKVLLPWIEDVTNRRFLELYDRQMVEVLSTTISRCTVRDFLEFFIDQDARRMCHQKTSHAPSPPPNSSNGGGPASASAGDQRTSEWHLHPHFGFVRKLSYRPPAPGAAGAESAAELSPLAASIAIDQYHSCSVNEKSMQRAVFRSKIFTLSIPNSNCFSVETVFEFQDTQDKEGIYALAPVNPVMTFKCRTGVHFTRTTMFSPQIEKGVLEGVRNTCEMLLRLADEFRMKRLNLSPVLSSSQAASEGGRPSLSSNPTSLARTPREAFPPHTLAVEVIKGMISAVRGNDRIASRLPSRARSSLVIQIPWTPALLPDLSASSVVPATTRARVGGFFECPQDAFERIVEEPIRGKAVSPSLVFDVLLSDECSFFHVVHKQSGNMEVDIGAWRIARFPVIGKDPGLAYVRKELFRMPVSGVTGLDVAHIEDYHYYTLQRTSSLAAQGGERLEFGMKIFARDLPDGDRFSIEILVVVDQASPSDETPSPPCMLRVAYAIAHSQEGEVTTWNPKAAEDDPLHAAVVHGTVRGLKSVWKRVVQVIQDAAHRMPRGVNAQTAVNGVSADDVRHRVQFEGHLPSHDELSSKIIESIASLY